MMEGLPSLYRHFWSEFVQTGNEAYKEFYSDPFVQAYVLYAFSSCLFHRTNPSGAVYLDENKYRKWVVPVLKKSPHLLHPFAASDVTFARHLDELTRRGSFQVDGRLVTTAPDGDGPQAWKMFNTICAGLQMNSLYIKGTLYYYLRLHRQCLQELGITQTLSKTSRVRAYEQAEKDFVAFDRNIAGDVTEATRFLWRRPHLSRHEFDAWTEYAVVEDFADLARSAEYGTLKIEGKMPFPYEVRNYEVYLGDVLIQAYKQIESLREWTGLPFDWKTFGSLQMMVQEKLPTIRHPRLWL